MELFAHQRKLLDLNPDTHLLAWGTGTGKTFASIMLANKNSDSVLIVCPKGLKTNWQREMKRTWLGNRYLIVSKEEFRRDWDSIEQYGAVIMDEMHVLAGKGNGQRLPGSRKRMGSQLHQAMYAYLKKHDVRFRYGLTATPFLRDAWNIFLIARLLGIEWNYFKFRQDFFYERYMGARTFWDAKPAKEDDIAALVHQLGSTVKLDECVDIPEAVFETEYFELTKEQKSAISNVKESLPIVRFTKHHQICGGALKGNEYTETEFIKCNKLSRVIELMEEYPKMIISCAYLAEMEILKAEISKQIAGTSIKIFMLDGSVDDKQLVIDQFNKMTKAILIVNAKCSEGWQAPTSKIIVFYSSDFSLKNKIQMEGRIRRIDHPQPCTYLSLVCVDSIDEAVVKALNKKQNFDIAIYNYGQ